MFFFVKCSVGDHSGSHSERYVLNIGAHISHQSPDYGEVGSGVYTLQPGIYTATIQHIGTDPELEMPYPDYDYTAFIEPTAISNARVTVNDPTGRQECWALSINNCPCTFQEKWHCMTHMPISSNDTGKRVATPYILDHVT